MIVITHFPLFKPPSPSHSNLLTPPSDRPLPFDHVAVIPPFEYSCAFFGSVHISVNRSQSSFMDKLLQEIAAIEKALDSFADFEDENDRRRHLREQAQTLPCLKKYVLFDFTSCKQAFARKQEHAEKLALEAQKQQTGQSISRKRSHVSI